MSYTRPKDYVTLSLSDQDLRDLVAAALDRDIIYTPANAREKVTIKVDEVSSLSTDEREGWYIQYHLHVEKTE